MINKNAVITQKGSNCLTFIIMLTILLQYVLITYAQGQNTTELNTLQTTPDQRSAIIDTVISIELII